MVILNIQQLVLKMTMEQSLRSVLIHLFTSVRVTSQSLKLFNLFSNELMYDRRPALCLSFSQLIVQLFC